MLHCGSMPMNLLKNKHLRALQVISAQNFPQSLWNVPARYGARRRRSDSGASTSICMNLHHNPPRALCHASCSSAIAAPSRSGNPETYRFHRIERPAPRRSSRTAGQRPRPSFRSPSPRAPAFHDRHRQQPRAEHSPASARCPRSRSAFIQHQNLRSFRRADLRQNPEHFRHMLRRLARRSIHHMQDQRRVRHFLQRRAKRLDQRRRQIANETDRSLSRIRRREGS